MRKLNRLTEVLALAAVALLGHPDTGNAQTLIYNPSSLAFSITGPGGTAPSQPVTLTASNGAAVSCAAIGSISTPGVNPPWVSASCNGNTLNVAVDSAATSGLPPNSHYTATIGLNTNVGSSPSYTVTLDVGSSSSGGTGGLVANPASVAFSLSSPLASGQLGTSQTITVTYNGGSPGPISTNFTPGNTFGGVVFVNTSTNSAAGTVTLTPNSAATQTGFYSGTLTINAPSIVGATNSINVPVTLNIGGTGAGLIITPNSLNFSIQVAGTAPSQNATVTLNGSPATITNVIATSTPIGWLLPSIPSTVGIVNVGVSGNGLSPGIYNGSVSVVTAQGTLTLPVSLNVGGLPTLSVTPTATNFYYQVGTPNPLPQTISVASSGANVSFTATPTVTTGNTQWLVVSPAGLTTVTPSTITVSVNPAGLAAGATYTGNIRIDTFGGTTNTTTNIPVSLLVSNNPIVTPNPTSLSFTSQLGLNPPSQSLSLTSSGSTVSYTLNPAVTTPAGGTWLQAPTQTGATPGNVTVGVNTQGLAVGTYSGALNFTSPTAGNSTFSVPITLTITAGSVLQLSPTALTFAYQTGFSPPTNQAVKVDTTGPNVGFSVTSQINSGPAGWLNITGASSVAPGNFVVGINPTGLTPGTYTATVTVTPTGSSTGLTVPVTLVVSGTALLVASPQSITFTAPANSATASPAFQNVAVTSTDNSAITFTTAASTTVPGQNWLLVTQPTSPTNANITITANPTGLAVGTYLGSVTITATNPTTVTNSPQTIAVSLVITPTSTLSVTPTTLTFTQAAGGSAPAAQTISVTGVGGNVTFSATASVNQGGSSWLTVNPSNSTTPATLSVTANGSGLAGGTYTGAITITSPGSQNSQTVNVQLIVSNAPTLVANPNAITPVSYQLGSANPAAQTINLSLGSGGSAPYSAVASMSTGSGWLSVSPASGNTPSSISVSFTPAALTPGTYTGAITITATGVSNSPITLPVTLTVTPSPVITPTVASVQNAASYAFSSISPGMNVYIQGTNMGPATLATYHVGSNGTLDSTVAETLVTFDGFPAPIIYTSSTQVSVMVPYGVAGRGRVNMVVTYKGVGSVAYGLNVVDISPGLYTLNSTSTGAGSGTGQGAILNENSTINGVANPEQVGHFIQIYATGEGLTTPRSVDGALTPNRLPVPTASAPVSVTIGGIQVPASDISYAGEAPGSIAGQLQVNAKIPESLSAGPQPVFITVGGIPSQAGVVVQVRR